MLIYVHSNCYSMLMQFDVLCALLFLMDADNNRNKNKINQQNQRQCHQTIRKIYSPTQWICFIYACMYYCIIRLPKRATEKMWWFFFSLLRSEANKIELLLFGKIMTKEIYRHKNKNLSLFFFSATCWAQSYWHCHLSNFIRIIQNSWFGIA